MRGLLGSGADFFYHLLYHHCFYYHVYRKPGSQWGWNLGISSFVVCFDRYIEYSRFDVYLSCTRFFQNEQEPKKVQLDNVKVLSAKSIEQEKKEKKQRILEGQKEKLEVMVKERTRELEAEKRKKQKNFCSIPCP